MKFLKIIGFGLAFLFQVDFAHSAELAAFNGDVAKLKITSFSDYMPFGYLNEKGRSDDRLGLILKKSLSAYLPKIGYKPAFEIFETTDDALHGMHMGSINLFVGAYYSSHIYDDFEFVFPSVLNNPVHLMMLPRRLNEVHNVEDLKNLKGVYSAKEYFADYVMQKFDVLGLKKVDSAEEAYKALIMGKADYILGSYYTNYISVVQSGLKNYIAFSAKPLWNMPMFLALSKMTPNLKIIKQRFHKLLENEDFKKAVLQDVRDFVEEVERNSVGVVPPTYINESFRKQNALTPADEMQTQEKDDN